MEEEVNKKLQYSHVGQNIGNPLPWPLKDSLQLISNFFSNNITSKLCLVFPSKEFAAQWMAFALALEIIKKDYRKYNSEIFKAYEKYRPGQKLLLNNKAVVEWITGNETEIKFRTKGRTVKNRPWENTQGDIITIKTSRIVTLRPAPQSKNALSARDSVYNNLSSISQTPLDKLLSINTGNNLIFQKNSIVLVSKFVDFEKSHFEVLINGFKADKYLQTAKIYENGTVGANSPLVLANNLSTLSLYTIQNPVSTIIIDGFTAILERGTDFSDIDVKNIPTILITDLSEIEKFEFIGNYGFEFFNFSRENLNIDSHSDNSPFQAFNKKLKKYITFNIIKEICQNAELENIIQKIRSIEKDESNNDLNTLKIYLIQLANIVSRICHIPVANEISGLNQKINNLETLLQRSRTWLGDSQKPIEESISLLKTVIEKLETLPSEKCTKLKTLMSRCNYDYIICPTVDEACALRNSLVKNLGNTSVISVADINENLLTDQSVKAIITGWPKSKNINRILSSFFFSELTVLFYPFENNFYNSLQRRNRKFIENVKPTISKKGIQSIGTSFERGFDEFYSVNEDIETSSENQFDILEFELKLDDVQYFKYKATGGIADSVRAKRIDFENDSFIYYASESHKLLVINNLIEGQKENIRYHRKKAEALKAGDIIALINTDRDILAELVEKNTTQEDLAEVKQWTDLWKNLLKKHFISIGSDFKKLVEELRKHDCKKHEVTIRTWLQDENRIGPDDDSDLISIALLTDSDFLNDNIDTVRKAIRKMIGWRMRAADAIIKKIKSKIHEFADISIVNNTMVIEELGSLTVLRIGEISEESDSIDGRYINRLLQKDII